LGFFLFLLFLCCFLFLSGFFFNVFFFVGFFIFFFFFFLFMLAVGLTLRYSLRFSFYSIKIVGSVRNKILMFYDSIVFVTLPVWLLISAAILLGVFWVDFIRFHLVFFCFFRGLWKSFYLFFFLLTFLFVYLLFGVFSSFLSQRKYFLRTMWYLAWVVGFRSSLSSLILSSLNRKIVDQGWLEICGPQGLSINFTAISYSTLRTRNYIFLVVLLPVFLVMLLLTW